MEYELIFVRAVHFVSTLMVGGAIFFQFLVADPALREANSRAQEEISTLCNLIRRIIWISLAAAMVSGIAWIIVVSAMISGAQLLEPLSEGTAWMVLTQTQFGNVWTIHFALGVLLSGWLLFSGHEFQDNSRAAEQISVAFAAGFLGTLAWAGHAAATPGQRGLVHLISDALHVISAGAWVGGLAPLTLLLTFARRYGGQTWLHISAIAIHRFSTFGVVAVATLLATGVFHTWILVGSVTALVESDYGRLLLLKIASFIAMVGLAAFNLLILLPRAETLRTRRLERNALVEAVLGFVVVMVVSVLGTMAPAAGMHMLHSH